MRKGRSLHRVSSLCLRCLSLAKSWDRATTISGAINDRAYRDRLCSDVAAYLKFGFVSDNPVQVEAFFEIGKEGVTLD